MNNIIELLLFFIGGIVFSYINKRIMLSAINSTKNNKVVKEKFNSTKFKKGLLSLNDKVLWIKDLVSIFNIRKLIIYIFILSIVFGYGWYKGRLNTPVSVDINYSKEMRIDLNKNQYLYKPKNSNRLELRDSNTGKLIKVIKTKDIPELKEKLKPIGFDLEPIFVAGYGIGEKENKPEIGGGISFLRYFKMKLDTFLTNRGIYLGTSYKITDNSGIGVGVGKGYKGDNRVLFYYKWKF